MNLVREQLIKARSGLYVTFSKLILAELRRTEVPLSGAPYSYKKEKETYELIFSWLSWPAALLVKRTHDDDEVAQHGGHTPKSRLTDMQPWFTLCFFDIGHPCFNQLTPIKTRYLLTCITWPYRGLKYTAEHFLDISRSKMFYFLL